MEFRLKIREGGVTSRLKRSLEKERGGEKLRQSKLEFRLETNCSFSFFFLFVIIIIIINIGT